MRSTKQNLLTNHIPVSHLIFELYLPVDVEVRLLVDVVAWLRFLKTVAYEWVLLEL